MTITRRSLMVLGVLLAVLAASTGIAQAQAPSIPSVPTANTHGYGTLRITITPGSNTQSTDTYSLRYEKVESGTDIPGEDDTIMNIGAVRVYDLTGLEHGTRYVVAVRAHRGTAMSTWSTAAAFTTLVAPDLGRVSGVEVTAMDGGAMATWTVLGDATGAPIHRYEWRTTTTSAGGSNGFVDGTELEAMITGLTNGVEYTVSVRGWGSLNGELDTGRMGPWSEGVKVTPMAGAGATDDPDPDPMPTPTPAVPLAGILALFAGLLAAARARLRRR